MHRLSVLFEFFGRLKRQHAILLLLVSFAVVVAVVTSVVLTALQTVAARTNALDENRSRQALAGALSTLQHQMETTIHDYTVWDDAAQAVYGPDAEEWILQNFALNGESTELFDTAFILGKDENVVMAYRRGEPFAVSPAAFFSAAFHQMVGQVRRSGLETGAEATGFIRTAEGIAVVGISTIRAASPEIVVPPGRLQQLVFVRHLDEAKVNSLADTYAISGLKLVEPNAPAGSATAIKDPSGVTIAKFTWTAMAPGDISYRQVQPYVLFAMGLAGLFFVLLVVAGSVVIEKLRDDETAARRLALTDRLSGLRNRAGLFGDLQAMIAAARIDGRDIAFFYLDMDGFKEVNDVYGHATGDRLIKSVSAGLAHLVPQGALLARLGGDEFAIAFPLGSRTDQAELFETHALDFFSEPFILGDRIVVVGASIGRAISTGGDVEADELLRRADIAMYRAKAEGRGRVVVYDAAMDADLAGRKTMEIALRSALANAELHVVYQPIVDVKTRRIVSLEALLRWNSPKFGPVPPDVFIPLAESTGLIDSLGLFVLGDAMGVARRWPDLAVSVNVSPAQFRNPFFLPGVAALIGDSGVDPARLTLEVTEGYLISNPSRAREAFAALKDLGVQIALDDFGAGFSSIGYLRQFHFDRLKLDRSLVRALDDFPRARDMLQATLALAASLDIPVTAEGIETEEQAMVLTLCGCDQLQGFFFSRPVPEVALSGLLNASADGRQALLSA